MRWILVMVFAVGCVSAQRGNLPSKRWPHNRQQRDEAFADLVLRVQSLEQQVRVLSQPKPVPNVPIDAEEPPKPTPPN